MADVRLNIRNLQEIDTIGDGDLIIVETTGGTRILDFKNFTLGKDNTTFAGQLSSMDTAIVSNITRSTTITGALLEGKQELFVKGLSAATPLSARAIVLRSLDGESAIQLYPETSHDVLSVTATISSARTVFGSGGNSMQWNSVYSNSNTNSGAWTNTNTTMVNNSGTWIDTTTTLRAESAYWDGTYNLVNSNSATWGGGSTKWTEPGGSITRLTNASNKVGIGTSAPGEKLTVTNNISAGARVYAGHGGVSYPNGDSSQWTSAFYTVSTLSATWASAAAGGWTDDGAVVRLTTAGDNVGIGTAVNGYGKLTVAGAISSNAGLSANGIATHPNYFSGKTGVGTNLPESTLHVAGTAAFADYIRHAGDPDTFVLLEADKMSFIAGNETLLTLTEASQDVVKIGDGGDVDININDDIFVEGSSSKVGIGTTAPGATLTVAGSISSNGDITAGNNTFKFGDNSSMSTTSLSTFKATHTTMQAESGDWKNTHTHFKTHSGNWETTRLAVTANQTEWTSTHTDVNANSGYWTQTVTTMRANSGGWANTDNRVFKTVSLSSQKVGAAVGADVVADTSTDTLILSAGPNIALFSDPTTDAIVISAATPATGGIDGSGSANYVPKFSDSNTLTNSQLTEVSNKIGIGLGSTNPGERLSVADNISASGNVYTGDSNSIKWRQAYTVVKNTSATWSAGTINHSPSAGRLAFYTAAGTTLDDSDSLFFNDTLDRFGIGTTAPSESLTVLGNISAQGGLSAGAGVNYFGGKVGIGTNKPTEELTVVGDITATGSIYDASGLVGSSGPQMARGVTAASTLTGNSANWGVTYTRVNSAHNSWDKANTTLNASSGDWEWTNSNVLTGAHIWNYVAANSATSQAGGFTDDGTTVRLTTVTDKVGIGTAAPGEKLTVSGNISANGGLSANGSLNYFTGRVGIGGTSTPLYKASITTSDTDGTNGVLIDHNETMSSLHALKIDSEAPTTAVTIEGGGLTITQDISSQRGIYVTRNINEIGAHPLATFFDDSSANTQPTLKVRQDGTGDIANFFGTLSGISNKELFTILDDGKVGINHTAPGYELTVVGAISCTGNIYASAGTLIADAADSVNTASVYNTVNTGSGDWDGAYTATSAGSANWNVTYTRVNSAHNSWDKTFTTVNSNSSTWSAAASAGWIDDGAVVRLVTAGDIVSIGTTASGEKLTVAGGISAQGNSFFNNLSASNIKFGTSNPVVIQQSGMLGVNKISPSSRLHVEGTATFDGTAAGRPHLTIAAAGSTDAFKIYDGPEANNKCSFVVADGGNVGIGTPNPTTTLTVSGSISAQGSIYVGNESIIFADGNTFSTGILSSSDSTYATMTGHSANWDTTYTRVASAHNSWDKTHTTLNANSASWLGINRISLSGSTSLGHFNAADNQTVVISAGPGINFVKTSNVLAISSTSYAVDAGKVTSTNTTVRDFSGTWNGTRTVLNGNSGYWNQVITTVRAKSGAWGGNGWTHSGTTVSLSSVNDKVIIGGTVANEKLTVAGNISARGTVYGTLIYTAGGTSAGWNWANSAVLTGVNVWNSTNTDVKANSGYWNQVVTTVRAASSSWGAGSLWDSTGTSKLFTVSSVGIGISTPDATLHVVGNTTTVGIISGSDHLSVSGIFIRGTGDGSLGASEQGSILPYADGLKIMPTMSLSGGTDSLYLGGDQVIVDNDFVVVSGVLSGSGGRSDEWTKTYTTVKSSSSTWDSTYRTFVGLSASFVTGYTDSQTNKTDIAGITSTLRGNSANWQTGYTNSSKTSGGNSNFVMKKDTGGNLADSLIYQAGDTIGIGTGTFTANGTDEPKLIVAGALSAKDIRVGGLSGVTTGGGSQAIVVSLMGGGSARLGFTNGILTSLT